MIVDLKGKTFGKLFVIERFHKKRRQQVQWVCHCDCGNFQVIPSNFLIGRGKSDCGCEHKERVRQSKTLHGYKYSKEYGVVDGIIRRCHDTNKDNYVSYGAKGIFVCDEWRFDRGLFCKWLEDQGYRDGLQVDRIDNDKGYSPDNCRLLPNSFNGINKKAQNRTGVCGVNYKKDCSIRPYLATIRLYGKEYTIGRYSLLEDAKQDREFVAKTLCDQVALICKEKKEQPVSELKQEFINALEGLLVIVKATRA